MELDGAYLRRVVVQGGDIRRYGAIWGDIARYGYLRGVVVEGVHAAVALRVPPGEM